MPRSGDRNMDGKVKTDGRELYERVKGGSEGIRRARKGSFRFDLLPLCSRWCAYEPRPAADVSPVQYLFKAPPMPAMMPGASASHESFERYQSRLQSQVVARTPLLDEALSPLELRASRLKRELDYMDVTADGTS